MSLSGGYYEVQVPRMEVNLPAWAKARAYVLHRCSLDMTFLAKVCACAPTDMATRALLIEQARRWARRD